MTLFTGIYYLVLIIENLDFHNIMLTLVNFMLENS